MRKSKVIFIGLGRLGFHMSSHLSKNKNIDLYIFNRSKNKLKLWSKNNKSFLYSDNINGKFDFIISSIAKSCGYLDLKENYKCNYYKPLVSNNLIN